MKKLFCMITLVVVLLSCLTLPAAADHDYADFGLNEPSGLPTLSEDLQVLSLKGHTYRRFDLTKFNLMLGGGVNLELTGSQKSTIESGLVYWDMEQTTAKVVLELAEGAQMTLYFVNDHCRSQVEALLSGEKIRVHFYQNGTAEYTLVAPVSDFRGNEITVNNASLISADSYTVFAHEEGLKITYQKGVLYDDCGSLYYLDFDDNGIAANEYYKGKEISVKIYAVTNEDLKAELYEYGVGVSHTGELPDTSLSDDMEVLTLKGKTYYRMNLSGCELHHENYGQLHLSKEQKKNILSGTVQWDGRPETAQVTLKYADGTEVTMYFVIASLHSEVSELIFGEDMKGRVEFYWPNEHMVIAPLADFKGTAKSVDYGELSNFNTFLVYSHKEGLDLQYRKGMVLENRGTLYYVDFAENNIDPDEYFDLEGGIKQVYEIADEHLKAELLTYIEEYYDDGVGMFYDEAFTEKLSAVVLIVLFAGVPGLILIVSVVLLIKSKGYQRKSWIVTASLSTAALVVFSILTVWIMGI